MKKHTAQGLAFIGVCIAIGLAIFVVIHGNWSAKNSPTETIGNAADQQISNSSVASAPTAPALSAYINKYPSDKVDEVSFWENPTVVNALAAAFGSSSKLKILKQFQVETPIKRQADKLLLYACEQNNCGNDVTILVREDGSSAEVCLQDLGNFGDGKAYWFANGTREQKSGDCSTMDTSKRDSVVPNPVPEVSDDTNAITPIESEPGATTNRQ